jgi:hypothetical protein
MYSKGKKRIDDPELDRLISKLWGEIMDIGTENVSEITGVPSSNLHELLCRIETIDELPPYLKQLAIEIENTNCNEDISIEEWWN